LVPTGVAELNSPKYRPNANTLNTQETQRNRTVVYLINFCLQRFQSEEFLLETSVRHISTRLRLLGFARRVYTSGSDCNKVRQDGDKGWEILDLEFFFKQVSAVHESDSWGKFKYPSPNIDLPGRSIARPRDPKLSI
jgi:hypothetical protein